MPTHLQLQGSTADLRLAALPFHLPGFCGVSPVDGALWYNRTQNERNKPVVFRLRAVLHVARIES